MRLIPLTQGKFAQVDDEDYIRLSQYKWYYDNSGHGYAVRKSSRKLGKQKTIAMHNQIIDIPKGYRIDHINNLNTLNNQKTNLRLCTISQNGANRKKNWNGSAKYKGIVKHKSSGKWQAQIRVNGNQIYLGLYISPEDAAKAYDKAAKENFGEFANINFGDES